ncbi:MAG: hypothetical protein AUI36_02365 [Cyanobacteria bacterium 13_1_40CM_2_61_4]|nr:MAG: hypothetical protein AUI36_02365 [Cyanobacteria bacterium 13_1_40CM_2_61_4]
MSVNKYQPHVLVLPEDDANRQLATGFHLQVVSARQRQMQVLPVAGGWNEVLNLFESEHAMEMDRCPHRFMVLLIDSDGIEDRLENARVRIPMHLTDRVFILGALSDPEDLRQSTSSSYETIGKAMAEDCREGTDTIWAHDLLRHNALEIDRLRQHVRPILFA